MRARGVVASVGIRTAIGLDALKTAMSYRAGAAGMREAPIVDPDGDRVTMCYLPTLHPLSTGAERAVALAAPALDEALAPLAPRLEPQRLRFVLCLDERFGKAAHGREDAAEAATMTRGLAEHLARSAPGVQPDVVARGAAGGAPALERALSLLEDRSVDVAVLGAVHTDYAVGWLRRLAEAGRLFKPDNLDALIPGEAACFAALMREDVARRYGLSPMAGVVATASATERAHEGSDHSRLEAKGLTLAVRQVGESLRGEQTTAGWGITDLTFERRRVLEWQAMLVRTRQLWSEPYVIDSPAQRIGHLGACAIPLGLCLVAVGWRTGSAPADAAILYGGSDDGERGAVLAAKPGAGK